MFEALIVVCVLGGAVYARARLGKWSRALWSDLGVILEHSKKLEAEIGELRGELADLRGGLEKGELARRVLSEQVSRALRLADLPAPMRGTQATAAPGREREGEILSFFRSLDHPDEGSRQYLDLHWERSIRTLTLAPKAEAGKSALELGAYLQMAAGLHCVLGYETVRAAYYGAPGHFQLRSVEAGGKTVFAGRVDLFDAEKHRYPYADGSFALVLACEIIEHLLHDPMHMLTECARVLEEDGVLILTTPNVASLSSVARVLGSTGNPQVYSLYPLLESERPHVREFTPQELAKAAQAAGFEIDALFTEGIAGVVAPEWVPKLLSEYGMPTELRGEQTYLRGRKKGGMKVERRPSFLYEDRD